MTDLGTLGGTNSSANAVSADGSVIVGYSDITGNNAPHAFKYSGSTMSDLSTLGGTGSSANAVSADGSVIVGISYITGNSATHAFKYSGSTMSDLSTLGGTNSSANAVSADGSVIVGSSDITGNSATHAFKYSGSTMSDLGTLGGTNSSAVAVSADGSVIVGYSDITGNRAQHAFKYSGSTMSDLGTLGGTYSSAIAVSADGKVIVGSSEITGNSAQHAFKYSGSTMSDLGTLGGTSSSANAVSADGKVIVGSSDITGNSAQHAFVYRVTDSGGGGVMVDVPNTYSALVTNSYQLNSLLNAQNTALAVNLNSDCTVYGTNNVCVGVGGRYTNVSSPTTSQTAGNIQIGYRFAPSLRAGVFLDQGISNATPNNYTVKNSQPLAGLFAVYAPSGTTLGVQVKASAAYSSNGVNVTRTTLANTEAGQGTSTMTTQGAQLESAYGFAVGDSWIASPLAGIRATSVVRNGYTETAGATFPITYNSVTQSATTAYAGAKVMGYVTPTVSVGASAGVEQDLNSNISNYSGSIYYLGAFSLAAPSIQKTRPFVSANADYWVEKNQRVSLSAYYNQQSLNTSNGITTMLTYTIGL
jgi:probable HAF family extracellular repeat protein